MPELRLWADLPDELRVQPEDLALVYAEVSQHVRRLSPNERAKYYGIDAVYRDMDRITHPDRYCAAAVMSGWNLMGKYLPCVVRTAGSQLCLRHRGGRLTQPQLQPGLWDVERCELLRRASQLPPFDEQADAYLAYVLRVIAALPGPP